MHQDLLKVLFGKIKLSQSMSEDEKQELEMKAYSAIQFCLAEEVLRKVADEDIAAYLWLKLESLYITKFPTNKLYLRQHSSSLV